MSKYRLFGGTLGADIELPELSPALPESEATWVLQSLPGSSADEPHGELLGTDDVNSKTRVALYRRDGGLRMVFDDTGCFEIAADARTIRWYHDPDVSLNDVRADLTGRVIAAALHLAGTISLHGSAVVLEDRAIGLIAPKYHGKSTLALALVASGGRLLTDDTLPLEPGSPIMARPGLHATRLWADSAARVGLGEKHAAPEGAKQLFSALPDHQLEHASRPLDALYVLSPVKEAAVGQAVRRTRLPGIEAAMVMIGHAKLAPLLAGPEAPVLFQRAAELADTVPVYRLNVVRDLERLDEVVATVREWHGARRASQQMRESA